MLSQSSALYAPPHVAVGVVGGGGDDLRRRGTTRAEQGVGLAGEPAVAVVEGGVLALAEVQVVGAVVGRVPGPVALRPERLPERRGCAGIRPGLHVDLAHPVGQVGAGVADVAVGRLLLHHVAGQVVGVRPRRRPEKIWGLLRCYHIGRRPRPLSVFSQISSNSCTLMSASASNTSDYGMPGSGTARHAAGTASASHHVQNSSRFCWSDSGFHTGPAYALAAHPAVS